MMKDAIDPYDKVCHGIVPLYFVLRSSLNLLEKCFGSPLTKFSFHNSNELSVLIRTLQKYMSLYHLKSPKVGYFRFMSSIRFKFSSSSFTVFSGKERIRSRIVPTEPSLVQSVKERVTVSSSSHTAYKVKEFFNHFFSFIYLTVSKSH